MIKQRIQIKYVHQFNLINNFSDNTHIADYTEQTKRDLIKRSVEFFSPNPPIDINYFTINNPPLLDIDGIEFDNNSFVHSNGNPKSQCEAVIFPTVSTNTSWVLFCELKYSSLPRNNNRNLRKAIKQVLKTRYYYFQNGIITIENTAYLIASLPIQSEPFTNFSLTPNYLLNLKRKRNIVLRLKNSVEIKNSELLIV
ncbi:hypothetical protein ACFS5M_09710 [Lacinutrix iliipiscaria]|uniref:Endonuclease n=1 Tax=Lacinutrix iliipiscaria TaxID=1230532 RepID=A0ABW5WRS1_9FLAO